MTDHADTIRRDYTQVCRCEWSSDDETVLTINAQCVIHGSVPDPLDALLAERQQLTGSAGRSVRLARQGRGTLGPATIQPRYAPEAAKAARIYANPLRERLTELALDIGRLRRGTPAHVRTHYLVDRIADHATDLILMCEPSAAQLAAWTAPGDEDAITEAIRIVDERSRRLRILLGKTA